MFSNWALAQLAIRSPKSWTFKAGPRLARISRQPFKDSSVDLKIDDRHAELCSVMKQTSKTMDALAGGTRCIEAAVTKCFVTLLVRHIQSWGSRAGPCDCNTYIHASVWPCIDPEHYPTCPNMWCTTSSRDGANKKRVNIPQLFAPAKDFFLDLFFYPRAPE
jgi:hypothetical protein